MVAVAGIGYLLKPQIEWVAHWIADNFGIHGLMFLTMLCDSFPSPVSPDLALVMIAQGPLKASGFLNAFFIAIASVVGGHLAYWVGGYVVRNWYIRGASKEKWEKQTRRIQKWGALLVVLGAITPFPMSVTCIAAGFAKLPYGVFTLATLVRIPRILLSYALLSTL